MLRPIDLPYAVAVLLTSPLWLIRMARTGRLRTDWRARFGHGEAVPRVGRPRLLIHAVSVGEVNAVRLLVERLVHQGDGGRAETPEIVVAVTTDTGFARARAIFGERHHVVRYPLDFSWCVRRFLDRIQPNAVVLVELEIWPNFTAECAKRGIALCVVNGRLSERSFARYRRIRGLVRPSFARLTFAAVQNDGYAERFVAMGTPRERVHVTGTMKWDTAQIADGVAGDAEVAEAMGIDRGKPLVVAGSTARDEHALLRDAMPKGVQLLCAPRRPEWADEAAAVLEGCARRSRGDQGSPTGRFLLDTIGELRQAYALADLVVVGRSFGELHGSDMMEPVALGKATIVGPAVTDFRETMDAMLAGGGIVQTDRAGLAGEIERLLADPDARRELAERGRAVIRSRQGATERTAALLRPLL